MASGGTRPAGFVFQKSNKRNRLTFCCPPDYETWLNFLSSLEGLPIGSHLFLREKL